MTVFLIDKSVKGICSALFYSFTERVAPDYVAPREGFVRNFNDRYIEIATDGENSQRVLRALNKYGEENIAEHIKFCLMSCDINALKIAFDYARFTLSERRDVSSFLADKRVSDFSFTIKKVFCENHRLKGFIRFKETANGILYAPYSPDNDITEILCPHFVARLSGVPFIIHDVKRNKAGVSDGKRFTVMATENDALLNLSDDEKNWETLWKNYYKAVNIKERRNKKQQNNLMPLRYRKFLPETYE